MNINIGFTELFSQFYTAWTMSEYGEIWTRKKTIFGHFSRTFRVFTQVTCLTWLENKQY